MNKSIPLNLHEIFYLTFFNLNFQVMTRNKIRPKKGKRKYETEEEIRGFKSIKKDKKPSKRINLADLYDDDSNFDSDEFYNNMGHSSDK